MATVRQVVVPLNGRDRTRTEVVCSCGADFIVYEAMGEPCPGCGQWYSFGGQRLRPPTEWGEETGERFGSSGEYLGGEEDDW